MTKKEDSVGAILEKNRELKERIQKEAEEARIKRLAKEQEADGPVAVKKIAYVVVEEFPYMYKEHMLRFKTGELITDPAMYKAMLAGQCPIMLANDVRWHECPSCSHRFPEGNKTLVDEG